MQTSRALGFRLIATSSLTGYRFDDREQGVAQALKSGDTLVQDGDVGGEGAGA